jgi:hypothetical protein
MPTPLAQRSALVLALALGALMGACSSGGGGGGGGTGTTNVAAALASTTGNAQMAGCASAVVPDTPVVVVKNASGAPLAGQTVNFAVSAGGGTISATTRTTNANGQAGVSWTLGTAGAQALTVTTGAVTPLVYSATLTSNGPYCVELVYTAPPDPILRVAAENAAARWSSIISGAVPPQPMNEGNYDCNGVAIPAMQRTVKSMVIYVELAPIPSSTPGLITLGQAGPCWIRDAGGLTVVGMLKLNSDYLINNLNATQREDVVLHEMGHVLGFGTLWEPVPQTTGMATLLTNPAPTGSPTFVGTAASAKYVLAGAANGTLAVPVENCGGGGTINGHWREQSSGSPSTIGFGIELMTGYISAPAGQRNPLSAVTIAAMQDLGYTVSYASADLYTLGGQTCPAPLLYAPGQQPSGLVRVGNDWVTEGLTKPIGVVGRDGRVRPIYR